MLDIIFTHINRAGQTDKTGNLLILQIGGDRCDLAATVSN